MNNILLLNLRRYIEKSREDMSAIRFVAAKAGFGMLDFSIIVLIACEHDETIRYSQIAKKLVLKDANVSVCIRNMEKNGLCEVYRNPVSGRSVFVSLTPEAKKMLDNVPDAVSSYEKERKKIFLPLRLT